MRVLEEPLDAISRDARVYPAHLLPYGGKGLCLFAAAFNGVNDAIHMARQNMTVTCVDKDPIRLERMRELYPSDWEFVESDAWFYATTAYHNGMTWDAVSVDPFTGDAETRAHETISLWTALSENVVTLTSRFDRKVWVPSGWEVDYMPRSSLAKWAVLTRA